MDINQLPVVIDRDHWSFIRRRWAFVYIILPGENHNTWPDEGLRQGPAVSTQLFSILGR